MIQHEDGTISLEADEAINVEKEIRWITNTWLRDDPCEGVMIFQPVGRVSDYMLLPYYEPNTAAA